MIGSLNQHSISIHLSLCSLLRKKNIHLSLSLKFRAKQSFCLLFFSFSFPPNSIMRFFFCFFIGIPYCNLVEDLNFTILTQDSWISILAFQFISWKIVSPWSASWGRPIKDVLKFDMNWTRKSSWHQWDFEHELFFFFFDKWDFEHELRRNKPLTLKS